MDGHCVATVARLVAIVLMSRSSFHVSRFLSISWGMQRSNKHSQQSNAITCTCLTDWILIHYLGNVHLHQFFQENTKMPGVLSLTSDTLSFVCLIWGLDALDGVNNPMPLLAPVWLTESSFTTYRQCCLVLSTLFLWYQNMMYCRDQGCVIL